MFPWGLPLEIDSVRLAQPENLHFCLPADGYWYMDHTLSVKFSTVLSGFGAPGWLSHLRIQLWLRSLSHGL